METIPIQDYHFANMAGIEMAENPIRFGVVILEIKEFVRFASNEPTKD
jgi:hypothetical protein